MLSSLLKLSELLPKFVVSIFKGLITPRHCHQLSKRQRDYRWLAEDLPLRLLWAKQPNKYWKQREKVLEGHLMKSDKQVGYCTFWKMHKNTNKTFLKWQFPSRRTNEDCGPRPEKVAVCWAKGTSERSGKYVIVSCAHKTPGECGGQCGRTECQAVDFVLGRLEKINRRRNIGVELNEHGNSLGKGCWIKFSMKRRTSAKPRSLKMLGRLIEQSIFNCLWMVYGNKKE